MASGQTWRFLGVTHSVCGQCRALVPAKVVADGASVYFRRFCPTHGESLSLVRSDVADYLRTQRFLKAAWQPLAFHGNSHAACTEGCGFCARHEQHLCMPIVEITTRCDLACPICINSSGTGELWDMTLQEFRGVIDGIFAGETQVDVLNISGGEPLLHPRLTAIIDEALSHDGIVRVSVSTNGLRLLEEPKLLEELRQRNVVVSLQLDGLDEAPYKALRGRPLLREKLAVLDMLRDACITTSLVMTVADSVNESLLRGMLDLLFGRDHIVSLMIQPVAFTGRAAGLRPGGGRITIPDVVRLLGEAGHPAVHSNDFVPLPCSHPLCFSLAFYLLLDNGRAVPVNQLADAFTLMDSLANRIFYGLYPDEHERLREMIYNLWSGPVGAVPEGEAVLATLRGLLRSLSCRENCSFDAKTAFTTLERRVKSVFIHAFQDAETFDLARVRRCCQAYPQPDGTLIPACVRNVIGGPVSRNRHAP
jgi:hypothetical protein